MTGADLLTKDVHLKIQINSIKKNFFLQIIIQIKQRTNNKKNVKQKKLSLKLKILFEIKFNLYNLK